MEKAKTMMVEGKKQHQQPTGVKANTWITPEEYEKLRRIKGDISISLLIRRAIRSYVKDLEAKGELAGNATAR